jgi:nitrite reductase (NO-forming)
MNNHPKIVSLPTSIIRIAFGVIWLVDAFFKWQPQFLNHYLDFLTSAAANQPAFLGGWFSMWTHIISVNPLAFAYATAGIETLTAIGLVLGFAKRVGYIFAAIFSLLIWSTAEGFGGPYTSGSTDIGTGIIYTLVFILLFVSTMYLHDRLSVDALIVKKFPKWKKVS